MGAMRRVCGELGVGGLLPEMKEDGEGREGMDVEVEGDDKASEQKIESQELLSETEGGYSEETLQKLHTLLLETGIKEGKLVCGNCGFEYPVKEGVGNFLLPSHLV